MPDQLQFVMTVNFTDFGSMPIWISHHNPNSPTNRCWNWTTNAFSLCNCSFDSSRLGSYQKFWFLFAGHSASEHHHYLWSHIWPPRIHHSIISHNSTMSLQNVTSSKMDSPNDVSTSPIKQKAKGAFVGTPGLDQVGSLIWQIGTAFLNSRN